MGGAGSGTSGGAGGTFAGRTPRIVCPADAGGGGGGGGGALPDGDGPPYFDRGGATSDLDFEFNVTSLGGDVVPVALNASGQAVVKIEETFGSAEACRSFLIDASNSHEILVPGGSSCVEAIDVNDAGRVVGQLHPSLEAFLWQGGVASVLDSALGRPVAINNQNRVIFDSGVLWDAGIVTVLTLSDDMRLIPKAINNLGQIVGPFLDNRAALWEDGNISEIPMDWPEAINDLGHVLGVRDFNVGVWNGVTFRAHGSMMDVSTSRPMALNNHDEFVGTRDESPGDFPAYPFVAQGPQFTPLELAGIAVDINDSGDILGERHTTQTTRTGVLVLSRAARIWSRRGHCPAACCP
jgi:hypothetical protein